MPRKGGAKLSERERARLAVVPDLYAIYSGLLSESVIDMIAKQCDYDMDACVATLGDMVQDHPAVRPTHQPPTHAAPAPATAQPKPQQPQSSSWTTPHAPFGASSTSSNAQLKPPSAHSAASSSSSHSAPSAAAGVDASSTSGSGTAAPPKKKGILFISPRPSSELNKPQPPSVWKSANNAKQPAKRPWSGLAPAAVAGAGAAGAGAAHAGVGVDNSSSYSGAKALVAASASASGAASSSSSSYEQDLAAALAASMSDAQSQSPLQRGPAASSSFEEWFGEDANDPADVAALRRSIAPAAGASERSSAAAAVAAYTYTGFESQPYFALQPRLLAAVPGQVALPGQSAAGHVVLDPEAPSAAQVAPAADGDGGDVSESSPAHPRHPLHALYLQLNQPPEAAPAPARASWQQFAGAHAAAAPPGLGAQLQQPSEAELSAMTPAQAAAFQRQQHEAELRERRQFTGWMKQHERDKAQVKLRGIQGDEAERQREREREEREEREVAQALAAVAEAEAAAAAADGLSHLSLSPTDIPPMPALSHAQSRSSQEAVQAAPQQLVSFLCDMFAQDIDPGVVAAVVESVLAGAPPPPPLKGSGVEQRAAGTAQSAEERFEYRDLAQECCSTLLAILDEEERRRDADMRADHLLAQQQQQQEQQEQEMHQQHQQMQPQSQQPMQHGGPRGGKAWKKQQAQLSASAIDSSVPFVAAGLQMSDAEIAARMAVDPDFDPNALQEQQSDTRGALAAASLASSPTAPVQRNKRGHVVVPRGGHNAWAAQTPAAASVAPSLGAQWKLAALAAAFPFVDPDTVEQCFQANDFSFDAAKAHLAQLFPRALVDPAARPQPVATPWARRQQHHSKVVSTSAADAARGVITDQRMQASGGAAGAASGAAGAAAAGDDAGMSDELLEAALGPVLDNRAGGGGGHVSQSPSASDSTLRALADAHARRRAAYFGAAAAAFNRGAGAMAAQLASQGRAERAELRRAQSAAALATFVAQNQQQDCARCVDLHGLRVDEALRILAFVLQRHRRRVTAGGMRAGGGGGGGGPQSQLASRELSVVTGVGYHSQGGVSRAKLQPAVLQYLRQNGFTCSAATPGVIRVQVA